MSARTGVWWLAVAALAWRALLAARTPVPSEDGVSYLWMAQRFAAGDFAAPLGEVFPPLLPLLVAPWVALGADPFRAAQGVLAVLGALSVVACAVLARAVAGERAVLPAAALTASAALPARFCGEVYTEPAFILVIALALNAAAGGHWLRSGGAAGAGFWLRAEALVLPVALALARLGRAWRALLGALLAVALLALWRGASGHGFDPLPKLRFNWPKGAVGDGAGALLGGAAALPGAWLEAFGVPGIAAVLGLWPRGPAVAGSAPREDRARGFGLALLLALAVVVLFATRRRFLVAWWPLVLVFAVRGLLRLPRPLPAVVVLLGVALGALLGLRTTSEDRLAERDVARHLAARLAPGETIASDMTRVLYFAGQRPLPPRHLPPDELLAMAARPEVRFVVIGAHRATAATIRAGLAGFAPMELPASLAEDAATRGLAVLVRR